MPRAATSAKYPSTLLSAADIGLFTNLEDADLIADVDASETTFQFDDVTGFAAGMWLAGRSGDGFEIVQITSVDLSLNTALVTRARDGTVAVAHRAGQTWKAVPVAQALNQMRDDLIAHAAFLTPSGGSLTPGAVLFVGATGNLEQDPSSIFFDNTTDTLKTKTHVPFAASTYDTGSVSLPWRGGYFDVAYTDPKGAYSAIVNISGSTVTARQATGTLISSGTNAATVIQAAITYVGGIGGGVVAIGPGTFNISATLTLSSQKVALRGSGDATVLKLANAANVRVIQVSAASVTISDMTLDGNRANQTPQGDDDDLVFVNSTSYFLAENLTVINGIDNGIQGRFSDYSTVRGCTIKNVRSNGILWLGNYNKIAGNHIVGTDNQDGIFVTASVGSQATALHVQGNVIANNVIDEAGDFGIESGIHADYTTIVGNTIKGRVTGGGVGIGIVDCQYATVIGNTVDYFERPGSFKSIGFLYIYENVNTWESHSTVVGNTVYKASDSGIHAAGRYIDVIGNTIIGTASEAGLGSYGIYIASPYHAITGNTIRLCRRGISLDADGSGTSSHTSIANNVIDNSGFTGGGETIGIGSFNHALTAVCISGNAVNGCTVGYKFPSCTDGGNNSFYGNTATSVTSAFENITIFTGLKLSKFVTNEIGFTDTAFGTADINLYRKAASSLEILDPSGGIAGSLNFQLSANNPGVVFRKISTDTFGALKLSINNGIELGAGGASNSDIFLQRNAANIFTVTAAQPGEFRVNLSTGGVPAIAFRAAAADANATVSLNSTGGLQFGAGGASALDIAIVRTGSNTASITATSGLTISGDILPNADNSRSIGTASLRYSAMTANTFQIFAASGDTQPTSKLSGSTLFLGAGGGTTTDISIGRQAANIVEVQSGVAGSVRYGMSGAGAAFVSLRAAAADANPFLNITNGGLSMGAGGASTVDVNLSRGAADRWDIASGDSFRLVLGSLQMGAVVPGTSGTSVIAMTQGTEPTTSPADSVQFYAVDTSAGNCTLGLRTEAAVVTETVVSDRTLLVRINGTNYKICLKV